MRINIDPVKLILTFAVIVLLTVVSCQEEASVTLTTSVTYPVTGSPGVGDIVSDDGQPTVTVSSVEHSTKTTVHGHRGDSSPDELTTGMIEGLMEDAMMNVTFGESDDNDVGGHRRSRLVNVGESDDDSSVTTLPPDFMYAGYGKDYDDDSASEEDDPALKSGIVSLAVNFLTGPDTPFNSTADIYNFLEEIATAQVDGLVQKLIPFVLDSPVDSDKLSEGCLGHITRLGVSTLARKPWALQFIDSFGKLPDGMLEGTISDLGSYDQCLRSADSFDSFRGRYCPLRIRPPTQPREPRSEDTIGRSSFLEPTLESDTVVGHYFRSVGRQFWSYPLTIGLCIPSSCNANDLHVLVTRFIKPYNITLDVDDVTCPSTVDQLEFSTGQLASFAVLATLAFIVLFATLIDKYGSHQQRSKLICAISLKSNFRRLVAIPGGPTVYHDLSDSSDCGSDLSKNNHHAQKMSLSTDTHSEASLDFVDGFKSLFLIWLVVANVYLFGGWPLFNMTTSTHADVRKRADSPWFQIILGVWSYVSDGFFVLSGLVACYTTRRAMDCGRRANFLKAIVYRVLRMLPTIGFAICLTLIAFSPMVGSGPNFSDNAKEITRRCEGHFWTDLTFSSNWFGSDKSCLPSSWWLAADLQLTALAFFAICESLVRPVVGVILSITVIMIGLLAPAYQMYAQSLPPTFMLFNEIDPKIVATNVDSLLMPVYNNLVPYFVGVLLGIMISSSKNQGVFKNGRRPVQWAMWLVTMTSVVIVGWLAAPFDALDAEGHSDPNLLVGGYIYVAIRHLVFASAVAWVAHECAYGRAWLLSNLMTSRAMVVIGRLSLPLFINHLIVVRYYFFTRRGLIRYDDQELLITACGLFLVSLFVALVCHLLIEAPCHRLLQHFFYKYSRSTTLVYGTNTRPPTVTPTKSDHHESDFIRFQQPSVSSLRNGSYTVTEMPTDAIPPPPSVTIDKAIRGGSLPRVSVSKLSITEPTTPLSTISEPTKVPITSPKSPSDGLVVNQEDAVVRL